MTVRNTKDGSKKPWLAEVYPEGREGPRKRKKFATKGLPGGFRVGTDSEIYTQNRS